MLLIARKQESCDIIYQAPDYCALQYIIHDLWPKLGFFSVGPGNHGIDIVSEYILTELILKNSQCLSALNLMYFKDVFTGNFDFEDSDAQIKEEDDPEDIGQGSRGATPISTKADKAP